MPAPKPVSSIVIEKEDGVTLYFEINVEGELVCGYCGYTCRPRKERPKKCPSCQRALWSWKETTHGEIKK